MSFSLPPTCISLLSALGFAKAYGATAERAADPKGWEMSLGRWVKNRQAYYCQGVQASVASMNFVVQESITSMCSTNFHDM